MILVVDASVAAKWYLHEPGSEDAAKVLTTASVLIAPALIRIEVTGAIIRRYREGSLSLERATEACDLWDADLAGGAIRLIPDDSLIVQARMIAFRIRHAVQDCLYLATAVEAGSARLVTADATFHARAVSEFPFVDLHVSAGSQ
jgi:predicted nucleic acid-binding protein